MPRRSKPKNSGTDRSSATLGFEARLWEAANALRGSMDAAEYKHVVLGLIFLKYISDAFEAHRAKLEAERPLGADPEDPDEYRAENIFWVPQEARWSNLQKNARQPNIGQLVDKAMEAVERENPSLKGVLPKDYARPALDQQRLGQQGEEDNEGGGGISRGGGSGKASPPSFVLTKGGVGSQKTSRISGIRDEELLCWLDTLYKRLWEDTSPFLGVERWEDRRKSW